MSTTESKDSGAKRAAVEEKPRILLLHGFGQNADTFAQVTKTLAKKLTSAKYELVYLQAPFKVELADRKNAFSWWYYDEKDHAHYQTAFLQKECPYLGFDVTRKLLEKTWKESGPFAAVIGFSQGAGCAALLSELSFCKDSPFASLRAAILVSGFFFPRPTNIPGALPCGCPAIRPYSAQEHKSTTESAAATGDAKAEAAAVAESKTDSSSAKADSASSTTDSSSSSGACSVDHRLLSLPSLHMLSESDKFVEVSRSRDLAALRFASPQVFEHPGGHIVPQKSAETAVIIEFLDKALKRGGGGSSSGAAAGGKAGAAKAKAPAGKKEAAKPAASEAS